MKITKIEKADMGGEKIVITVEGYEHAQPVLDAKITPEELEVALKAWKVNQDAVDAINLAAKTAQPKEPVVVDSKLTDMIGKDIK